MRLAAFAVLAMVASGCAVHVVEQPTSAVVVAGTPPPATRLPARPRSVAYAPVASFSPPAPPRIERPYVERPRIERPYVERPYVERPRRAAPLPKSWRVPFKTVAPEARSSRLTSVAPPTKHRRPQKVKPEETVRRVSSDDVTKAQ